MSSRQGIGVASQEPVDMLWLDSQLENVPSVLIDYFFNDLFQTVMDRTNQYLPASFGTPDDVIDDQMDCMLFMDIPMFHVDSLLLGYVCYQQIHPTQAALQGTPIHPPHEWTGLSGPFLCNTHKQINRYRTK